MVMGWQFEVERSGESIDARDLPVPSCSTMPPSLSPLKID